MNSVRRIMNMLSSKVMLLWLAGLWVLYYVTIAVWGQEAFEHFVVGVRDNPFSKALFILLLCNIALHIVQGSREQLDKGFPYLILWFPLILGIFLLLTGFLISINSKQIEQVYVGEGDTLMPFDTRTVYMVKTIEPNLKEQMLDIEEEAGLFSMEPHVVLSDGNGERTLGVYPPTKLEGNYFHIMDFGMAPGLRVMHGGQIILEGHMPQKILPPGSSDVFTVANLPYRVELILAPEKTIEKGGVKTRVYNLKTPLYKVRVRKGDAIVWEGLSSAAIQFDAISVSFFEPGYWARIEIVRDHGIPVVLSGLVLVVLGIPLRLALAVADMVRARRQGCLLSQHDKVV